MSPQTFRQLGVSEPVCAALAAREIESPFPIQENALPNAIAGRDLLAKSPTGSGKTLAFGLALIERSTPDAGIQALVLEPTRELCLQVAVELAPLAAARGLKIAAAYGGNPLGPQVKAAKSAQILVATPGRLNDLLERRMLSLSGLTMLVLDEADRMLDMGFKPQVDRIVRQTPNSRQTMLFSATLDGEVGEMAAAYTYEPAHCAADLDALDGKIEHRFVKVTDQTKMETLVDILAGERQRVLVFTRTKRGADKLAEKLSKRGLSAAALHGDLNQSQRERALARFAEGLVPTLVATDVAARGLDLPEISHVVNFDPPAEDKDYTHRVGRTGRAGRCGVAVTFVLPEQQAETSRCARRAGELDDYQAQGMKIARAKLVYNGTRGGKWGAPRRGRRMI